VFSEMNMESAVLPDYHHIVFDEAHNLEAAATDHLSVEITFSRINQVLTRLYRPHRRKKGGTGLAASIKAQLASESGKGPKELMEKCDSNCDAIIHAVDDALHFVMPFFESLGTLLPASDRNGQVRFTEGKKIEKVWQPADAAKVALISSLAKVMRASENTIENMREMPSGSITYLRDFQRELEGVVVWIKEVVGDIEFVLAGTESNYVYWIEKVHPRQGGSAAKAAPLSIAEIMNDQVYARKRSCVFSSATLTIRNNFKFLSGRLGINRISPEKLETFQAPSPFDYDEQCVVAVPTFLAEPNQGQGDKYIEGLSSMLAEVYRLTEGRGMALFTSYRMLQGCHKQLQQSMKGDGITILAQGQSGSREHITTLFKNDIHSVLLGTHSFWEGVDVVGESLSCLTIARLPFGVFTDPIIAARCEKLESEGKDPFLHYSLPSAVIRFKQGFGRLIRSRQDKGLIIVADRRVVAKRYGSIFLQSIPTHTESFNDRSEFLDMVEHFFRNNINRA
jgi:Rad3-related DNA helicase